MNRREWFAYNANMILENLDDEQNQMFNRYFSSDPVYKCCIILNIIMEYYRGTGVYIISEKLTNRFKTDLQIEYIATKLVFPLCQKFILGDLNFPNNFSLEDVYSSFLQYILSLKENENTVVNILKTYFGFTEEKVIQDIISKRKPLQKIKAASFFYDTCSTMQRNFYTTYKEVKDDYQAKNLYNDLLKIKIALISLEILKDSILETNIDKEDKEYFILECNKINKNIKEHITKLSYIELDYFINKNDNNDENIINTIIKSLKKISIISQQLFPIFPEVYKNKQYIPQSIIDYVFTYNGRQRHLAIGQIPYCYICDTNDLSNFQKLGIAEDISIKNNKFELNFVLSQNEDAHIRIPYFYNLNITSDIYELLLMIKYKRLRFDILKINNIKLKLLCSHLLTLPDEILQKIKDAIMPILEKQFHNNDLEFYNSFINQKLKIDLESQFMACEFAKSEIFFNQYDNMDPNDTEYKIKLHKYNIKKNELYKLRKFSSKANGENKKAIENKIKLEKAELEKTAQEIYINHIKQDKDFVCELKTISSILPPNTCFGHFLIHDNYLDFLYTNKDAKVKRIDLSCTDIVYLHDLFYKWKDSKNPKREIFTNKLLEYIGINIALPLLDKLKSENIKRIILSTIDFLDGIPLHCSIVRNGQYLCDEFESITYAPTLSLLYKLTNTTRKDKDLSNTMSAVINTGDKLNFAHKEADLLKTLFPNIIKVFECPSSDYFVRQAKLFRAIHIGTHGNYEYGNFWDACLVINNTKNDNLTIAQIVSDADLNGVQLVNLAACSSGLSSGRLEDYRNYAGMDVSFMIKGAKTVISALWNINDIAGFLYSCCLYWQLSKGKSIETSHKISVDYLKQNRYVLGHVDTELKNILDKICPNWKESININLSKVVYWGCFKVSGLGQNKI